MINADQHDLLMEIFRDTERLDKITISLERNNRDMTVIYEHMDDQWFREMEALTPTEPCWLDAGTVIDDSVFTKSINDQIAASIGAAANFSWDAISTVEWEGAVIYNPRTGEILDRIDLTYSRLIDLCNTPCWRYKA